MNIYVGNLSYGLSEDDLRSKFEEFGAVKSAKIVTDESTSKSKGFGFVEMENAEEAKAAIDALNGTEIDGREARVSEARPKK